MNELAKSIYIELEPIEGDYEESLNAMHYLISEMQEHLYNLLKCEQVSALVKELDLTQMQTINNMLIDYAYKLETNKKELTSIMQDLRNNKEVINNEH